MAAEAWLLSGDGGAGKTRLAAEAASRLSADGWAAGFVPNDFRERPFQLPTDKGLFLVLDYPEERPEEADYLDQFHASSVWSIARGNGEGRSIDLYQVFAEFLREDAKDRTTRATTELKTLLKELLHHEDMTRPEMRRSRSFVSDIIAMTDRQHEAFLAESGPLGSAALKQAFQNDNVFWDECAQLWGRGGGFRAEVARRTERWFHRHPKLTERLDDRLQELWNATFVQWLQSYLADNASGISEA